VCFFVRRFQPKAIIVVNAQPATPAVQQQETVTQPTCATATGGSNHSYTASNNPYFHTKWWYFVPVYNAVQNVYLLPN
jgi:hypothetical protein